ncbi:unnamed protein product [Cylicocyclus nassatus]|uniref:Uncharacterized protein n=1 Tax=Cylicocyclus nassatus TaxID=53992 RepID=A0AA36GEK7_CYLNA|nr:unnamed protein product [Cylicocyclus nassatus]
MSREVESYSMKLLLVIFLFMFLCQRNCESGIVDKFAEYNEINAPADDSVLDDKGTENKVLEDALRSFNLSAQSKLAATGNKSNSHPITSELYCDVECQKSRRSDDDLRRTRRGAPSQITTNHCKLTLFHENCDPAGEEISPGTWSMCTTCHRLYTVSDNCYPRYLHTKVCDGNNGGCAFENGKPQGTCVSTNIPVTLLRTVGDDNKLVPENLQVPSGCQCALKKHSFLSAIPVA